MIRMGWIGCGRHARQMLLPQLGRNEIRIAALCDRDGAALARTAQEFGVTACYADFREMISAGGIDAVGMAVGANVHRAAAIAALEAGLPVFMEKPPAADAAGARDVAVAARARPASRSSWAS